MEAIESVQIRNSLLHCNAALRLCHDRAGSGIGSTYASGDISEALAVIESRLSVITKAKSQELPIKLPKLMRTTRIWIPGI